MIEAKRTTVVTKPMVVRLAAIGAAALALGGAAVAVVVTGSWDTFSAILALGGLIVLLILLIAKGDRGETDRLRAEEQKLRHLAAHDPVTGLPNRRAFEERLAEVLARLDRHGGNAAIVSLDIDDFRAVNRRYGAGTADDLLTTLGRRLVRAMRKYDLVARRGGDTFCILLDGLRAPDDTERVVEKVRAEVAAPFVVDGRQVYLTCSAGAAVFPRDGRTPEDLLRRADAALHFTKRNAPGSFGYFTREPDGDAGPLEEALRRAREQGELFVAYQPRIDLRNDEVASVEALLRWNHSQPNGTFRSIPPSEFIPLAERIGAMPALTEFVLDAAFRLLSSPPGGHPVPPQVSVNVTGHDVLGNSLARTVSELAGRYDVSPSQIELEVPADVVFRDLPTMREQLDTLRSLGCRIAIDNYRADRTGLRALVSVAYNTLILDRSFVSHSFENPSVRPVVAGILTVGEQAGFDVVAQGIETAEQEAVFRGLGFRYCQGWFHGRPADITTALAFER